MSNLNEQDTPAKNNRKEYENRRQQNRPNPRNRDNGDDPTGNRQAARNDQRNRPNRQGGQRPVGDPTGNTHANESQRSPNPRRQQDRRERNAEKNEALQAVPGDRENLEKPRRAPVFDVAKISKKREETIEDIRVDIERIESDIQFEIKQIQTTQLGL